MTTDRNRLPALSLPALARSIHELRLHDERFVRRLRRYEWVDERLDRIERGRERASGRAIEALERERSRLGHELYLRVCTHARKVSAPD